MWFPCSSGDEIDFVVLMKMGIAHKFYSLPIAVEMTENLMSPYVKEQTHRLNYRDKKGFRPLSNHSVLTATAIHLQVTELRT